MGEMSELKISTIMTKNVIAANPNNTFSQLMKFFVEQKLNHLPVMDGEKLIGVISVKDMLKVTYTQLISNPSNTLDAIDKTVSIRDIMTPDPITAKVSDTIFEIKALFGKSSFNCLPIMHEGKVVGIVTPKDLMRMKIIHIDGADYGGY